MFHSLYGLETVVLRYFNVFGPRQDRTSQYAAVVPNFITALAEGKQPRVDGDGKQTRDFTFVSDVVEANLLACHAGPKAVGRVFNVACGRQYSILELLDEAQRVVGTTAEPVFAPPRPGDVRHSMADIAEAKCLLGFHPQMTLAEGLRRTASWFVGK